MDFCIFAKSMSKILSIEYSQKLLNSAKKPTTKATKTASKRGLQKTAEATGDLIGDKIADKITDDSKCLQRSYNQQNCTQKLIMVIVQ